MTPSELAVIQFGATVLALAVAIVICCFLTYCSVNDILKRIEQARNAKAAHREGWQFQALIRELDRWCCWHFPIIEDVCTYLLGPNQGIAEFRERLQEKYGNRETPAGPTSNRMAANNVQAGLSEGEVLESCLVLALEALGDLANGDLRTAAVLAGNNALRRKDAPNPVSTEPLFCWCGHLARSHEQRTHEVERGDSFCVICQSIHDFAGSAGKMRQAAATSNSVSTDVDPLDVAGGIQP